MAKNKSDGAAAATSTNEPVLSADALSKLTQRIQLDFEKAKSSGGGKGAAAGKNDKKKRDRKEKEKRDGGAKGEKSLAGKRLEKGTPMPSQDDHFKGSVTSQQQKPPKPPNQSKPKPRNGDKPKPQWKPERTKPGPSAAPAKAKADPFPKKAGSAKIDKAALLKEMIELGGTEEDLALIGEISSDDEEQEVVHIKETGKQKDVKTTDIEAFMKEIGLQGSKIPDVEEDEVDGEEEDSDEEDFDEDEEDEEDAEDAEEDVEMENAEPAAAALTTAVDKNSKLLFPKRPDWHAETLPPLKAPTSPLSPQEIKALHERAKELLKTENDVYSKTELVKSSDRQFLSQIMQSGTLTDKISALTLICQESPLHTTKTLESLLGLAQKKSRSQSIQALGAIKDLFAQGVCLPPNRKLKFFARQPLLGAKGMKDIHLVVWAYEEWLKNFYFEVLKCLEQLCTDQLVYARINAVGYVYELLKEKPEQEANLLRVLVNKLGDSDKKVASKVSYLLLQLMNVHPAMKPIIVKAIESEVVFKPGNHNNAKYYSIITLNQTVLSSLDFGVANKLLDIYFGVFTALLNKENAEKHSANATGAGKHIKFTDEKKQDPDDKKMNKKARLRAKKEEEQNQFEEESNAKLVSAVLTGVNRAFPFSKVDDEVFNKHMDTLFRITHQGNFNTSIQAMILIFQVSNSKQAVSDRFYRTLYESLLDQRLINSSKQAMYLNLLFRALKADTSVKRVKAFVKRIMQIATLHQPSFICGILYLLNELEVNMPSIRTLITDPEPNEEDDEEVFRDVPDSDAEALEPEAPKPAAAPKTGPVYDGRKRDPLHAAADLSCLWELLPFVNHFHPTVALYAQCLLEKKPMPSKPDLGIHTLTHFLDRFVYRNAKTVAATTRGTSIMQPLAGGKSMGMVLSTRDGGAREVPVNSEAFWKKKVEDVKPEEVFFHRYFNLAKPEKKSAKRKRDEDEDSEAGEDEIWQALVNSRPDVEGGSDVDFDDDDDLEMSMSDDDGDKDMGSNAELDLDEEDQEWDTEDDEEEEGKATGDAAADFEAQLAKASAKRQKMVEAGSDDEDDGGIQLLEFNASEDQKEVEIKEDGKKKKRKLKNLPTFASAEDYADMLSD
ncbi:CBF/Mak21 family-domain-containing protein [Sphaerosporella brunnea]|uniref:CBF/Mak21 family-domain-containing protein n=1 Tax=Sphaerosporella brunnea TaxID=1250544 RepID=A0A5J5EEP3_9PEZI|nr:CBF/Mak21 family-domain-containing protein [Sphaerosporella brunnea]